MKTQDDTIVLNLLPVPSDSSQPPPLHSQQARTAPLSTFILIHSPPHICQRYNPLTFSLIPLFIPLPSLLPTFPSYPPHPLSSPPLPSPPFSPLSPPILPFPSPPLTSLPSPSLLPSPPSPPLLSSSLTVSSTLWISSQTHFPGVVVCLT